MSEGGLVVYFSKHRHGLFEGNFQMRKLMSREIVKFRQRYIGFVLFYLLFCLKLTHLN